MKKFFYIFYERECPVSQFTPSLKGRESLCPKTKTIKKKFKMSEKRIFAKEDLVAYAKGSTKTMGKVTLPSGKYRVSHLELREVEINGEKRKFVDVHLVGKEKSGVVSATRFATCGFSKEPVQGRVKQKWYYPSKGIEACYEGDLADLLVEIQGKEIEIMSVPGFTPNFPLSSWATKKEAEEASKPGFAEKNFMRITKIYA